MYSLHFATEPCKLNQTPFSPFINTFIHSTKPETASSWTKQTDLVTENARQHNTPESTANSEEFVHGVERHCL
jgi:hypothetical protein